MTNNIYAVKDKKAEAFIPQLITHSHDAVAVRFFTDMLRDPQTALAKHPEDYDLYRLGQVDLDQGNINSEPQFIVAATTILANEAA